MIKKCIFIQENPWICVTFIAIRNIFYLEGYWERLSREGKGTADKHPGSKPKPFEEVATVIYKG